ncbi:hypothetical protein AAY473_037268, partial [Plecturocebus cupreus]
MEHPYLEPTPTHLQLFYVAASATADVAKFGSTVIGDRCKDDPYNTGHLFSTYKVLQLYVYDLNPQVETGFQHVGQTVLELLTSDDLPPK